MDTTGTELHTQDRNPKKEWLITFNMHQKEEFDASGLRFRPSAIFYPFLIMKLSMSELLSAVYGPLVSSSVMQNWEKSQNKWVQQDCPSAQRPKVNFHLFLPTVFKTTVLRQWAICFYSCRVFLYWESQIFLIDLKLRQGSNKLVIKVVMVVMMVLTVVILKLFHS